MVYHLFSSLFSEWDWFQPTSTGVVWPRPITAGLLSIPFWNNPYIKLKMWWIFEVWFVLFHTSLLHNITTFAYLVEFWHCWLNSILQCISTMSNLFFFPSQAKLVVNLSRSNKPVVAVVSKTQHVFEHYIVQLPLFYFSLLLTIPPTNIQ